MRVLVLLISYRTRSNFHEQAGAPWMMEET